jgi:hypothetical protein
MVGIAPAVSAAAGRIGVSSHPTLLSGLVKVEDETAVPMSLHEGDVGAESLGLSTKLMLR